LLRSTMAKSGRVPRGASSPIGARSDDSGSLPLGRLQIQMIGRYFPQRHPTSGQFR
jgi:hypothetical protein